MIDTSIGGIVEAENRRSLSVSKDCVQRLFVAVIQTNARRKRLR